MKKRILVVVAHPDDEVLGCGGTVRKFVLEGFQVYTLILGEGITSRDEVRNVKRRKDEIALLKEQAKKAKDIIGYKKIIFRDFPDNRFDSVPFLDIVKSIEKVKNEIKPDIIFTHCKDDLNVDHRITYKGVLTATRPVTGESVKEIYSFETPSSTELNYPETFSPDTFYDVTDTLNDKVKALEAYSGESKENMHPRSSNGIKVIAEGWGVKVGIKYAEAFKTIRVIK